MSFPRVQLGGGTPQERGREVGEVKTESLRKTQPV